MSTTPPTPNGLDLPAAKALLRAMAPLSYERGVRFAKQFGAGLILFLLGGVAAFTSDSRAPAAGLWLLTLALPYLALRWWQAGLAPRRILLLGLAAGARAGLGAALWLGLHDVLWGALLLCSALLLLTLAGRNGLVAWVGLGPLRSLVNPATLGAISATSGETK